MPAVSPLPAAPSDESLEDELQRLRGEVSTLRNNLHFGLLWEDQPEAVEEQLRTQLAVLRPDPDARVSAGSEARPLRPHLLIEGDNLHALAALQATHTDRVDFVCIDPPYNTGNEFRYNDRKVGLDDAFRHSAWLSFMDKRLRLALTLLRRSGVIAISIDDNEQSHLRLLCDEIFGEANFIACCPTVMNLKGNQDQLGFAGTHEYTLVYAKDRKHAAFRGLDVTDEEALQKWSEDERGPFKKGAALVATGADGAREKRPTLHFPIFVSADDTVSTTRRDTSDVEVLPWSSGRPARWRWSAEKVDRDASDVIVTRGKSGVTLYKKQRPGLGDLPTSKPKSTLYRPEYSSGNGTAQLASLIGQRQFDNPKPLDLIMDLVSVCCPIDGVVLDFFAGSGTSGHAVALLNERDKASRQAILVTNNENQICREVTLPRLEAVLNGTRANGTPSDPVAGSLHVFTTDFVSDDVGTDEAKAAIAMQARNAVQVGESAFDVLFADDDIMMVRNHDTVIAIVTDIYPEHERLVNVANMYLGDGLSLKAYLFTWADSDVEDETREVWGGWETHPLPSSMLATLRRASLTTKAK